MRKEFFLSVLSVCGAAYLRRNSRRAVEGVCKFPIRTLAAFFAVSRRNGTHHSKQLPLQGVCYEPRSDGSWRPRKNLTIGYVILNGVKKLKTKSFFIVLRVTPERKALPVVGGCNGGWVCVRTKPVQLKLT